MKYFIITIDTEGDNLWEYKLDSSSIGTQNARYIPRFQKLCEEYHFKPVYLVNYEMAQDDFFVDFAGNTLIQQNCEIGIHLHGWNNPPYYALQKENGGSGLPYLIEYPRQIMEEKFDVLLELLKKKFDADIVSHRSGRWAMNQDYFDMLINRTIAVDCSVTPHISWENSHGFTVDGRGSDYTHYPENPFIVTHSRDKEKRLWEVPVTIRRLHHFYVKKLGCRSLYSGIKNVLLGRLVWLRPNGNNLHDMLALVATIKKSRSDYLMFMLHSSELMPGGSPTFTTEKSIEILYEHLALIFKEISKDFTGITLKEYYNKMRIK